MASSAAAAGAGSPQAEQQAASDTDAATQSTHAPQHRGLKRSRGQHSKYIAPSDVAVAKEDIPGWQDMGKRQLKRAIRVAQSNKIRAIKAQRREANKDDNDVLFSRKPDSLKVGLPAHFDYAPFKAILDKPPHERSIKLNASARTRVRMAEEMQTAPAVLLDCCAQYEEWMKFSERSSVALQTMHAYSSNRQAQRPVWLGISGVSAELDGLLYDLGGHGWAIHCDRQPLSAEAGPPAMLQGRKMVYLSAEGDSTLDSVQADTAYIVGGIVDRNRHKGAAAQRANALGIPTARLPLQENLGMSDATVLTCLHVVQLLLRVWNGATWAEACRATLPQRKLAPSVAKRPRKEEAPGATEAGGAADHSLCSHRVTEADAAAAAAGGDEAENADDAPAAAQA